MRKIWAFIFVLVLAIGAASCGEEEKDTGPRACNLETPDCDEGLICAEVEGSEPLCLPQVELRGKVINLMTSKGISKARVQLLDEDGAPFLGVVETDAGGSFVLEVPAARGSDYKPVKGTWTFLVQAMGYQEFPTAVRPALPVTVGDATLEVMVELEEGQEPELNEQRWILESTLTTVGLVPLAQEVSTLGTISGRVGGENCVGLMVAAESDTAGFTGFTDVNCDYLLLNVAPGNYQVTGYRAGLQYTSEPVNLVAGQAAESVNLSPVSDQLSTVTGNVQLVNAPGDASTSVILALESTFVEAQGRGIVPPGLRVDEVTGAFAIPGVPKGKYVVLAAMGFDGLVRDPDQSIGGTRLVRIEVPVKGTWEVPLSESFKVTEALEVFGPGAGGPEIIDTATPTFEWADDSSETGYELHVVDALGQEVWTKDLPSVTGNEHVTVTYDGPALKKGMYYQFKAFSFREKSSTRTYISATEEIAGVFVYQDKAE